MKKENVFVPIESEKQANDYRLILEAMNQKVAIPTWYYQGKENGLWFGGDDIGFTCFYGANETKNTKITFGQLIDLLNEPKKLAVKVENEKEFKALMKYFKENKLCHTASMPGPYTTHDFCYGNCFTFHDKWFSIKDTDTDYQIIPFAEFAEEKGIKLPLITSEDGVDIFIDDEIFLCYISSETKLPVMQKNYATKILYTSKVFKREESALSWIDEQKPKTYELDCGIISDKGLAIRNGLTFLNKVEIEVIAKYIQELNKK